MEFVSKSKVITKDGREAKGHSHLEKSQDGNHFRRAFVGVPQSKAVALSINPVFSLDGCNNSIPDTKFQRSGNVIYIGNRAILSHFCFHLLKKCFLKKTNFSNISKLIFFFIIPSFTPSSNFLYFETHLSNISLSPA